MKAFDVDGPQEIPRREAVRWVHAEDVPKLEDAVHRALQTKRPQRVTVRIRIMDHAFKKFVNTYSAVWCDGTAPRCAAKNPKCCCLIYRTSAVEVEADPVDGFRLPHL